MYVVDFCVRECDEIYEMLINFFCFYVDGCLCGIVFGFVFDNGDYCIGIKGIFCKYFIEVFGFFVCGMVIVNILFIEYFVVLLLVE